MAAASTTNSKKAVDRNLLMDFLLGGMAGCGAVTFTNPLEVVKTRMQLLGELGLSAEGQYKSIFDAFSKIGKHEGIGGLQRGLFPAYLTQMAMNGIRLGSYDNIKEIINNTTNNNTFITNVVSGALAGSLAATVANPFEMTKTRFQAQGTSIKLAHSYQYTSVSSALFDIVKTRGCRGCGGVVQRLRCGPVLAALFSCRRLTNPRYLFKI